MKRFLATWMRLTWCVLAASFVGWFALVGCGGPSTGTSGGSTDDAAPPRSDAGQAADADAGTPPSSDAGATDANDASGPTTIGPAGGTLTTPSGAEIVIPPGALATPAVITFGSTQAPTASELGAVPVGAAFEAGPEGQTFLKPVEVRIPFDPKNLPTGVDASFVTIRMAPHGSTSFSTLTSTVDTTANVVSALTTHFTQFVPAAPTGPVAPLVVTTTSPLPNATVGVAYSQSFAATGGVAPYTWTLSAGATLPSGLSLNGAGVLSGTPTAAGNAAFFVTVTDSASHATQAAFSLTVTPPSNPVPVLTSMTPVTVVAGAAGVTLDLTGSAFVPFSYVTWDGSSLPTTFVSTAHVTASVSATLVKNVGTHSVAVVSPTPGGGTTATQTFTVTAPNPQPAVNFVSPSKIPVTNVDTQITVTGGTFIAGSSVLIGAQPIATTFVSSTSLTAIIPASYLATAGTLHVYVSSPPPGGGVSANFVTITVGNVLLPDTWSPITTANAPTARYKHVPTIWTGSEMIVWGGWGLAGMAGDGGRYSPSNDSWTLIPAGALTPRIGHTAVWTGTRMIVWGGTDATGYVNDGASFDPGAGQWTPLSTAGAPLARTGHVAVWTGSKMIVWSGLTNQNGMVWVNDGALYDPATDTWTAMSNVNAPEPREGARVVWTGSKMIVWGGDDGFDLNTGGIYDPATDTWSSITTVSAPSPRHNFAMVWTGSKVIVWGGTVGSTHSLSDGGVYDPATDTWTATAFTALHPRESTASVWTGTEMIVWGGAYATTTGTLFELGDGAKYSPDTNTWTAVSATSAPAARYDMCTVWTGSQMVVWSGGSLRTGATYTP